MKIAYKSDPADREKARRMVARVQTLVVSPPPMKKQPVDNIRSVVASRNLEGTRLTLEADEDENDLLPADHTESTYMEMDNTIIQQQLFEVPKSSSETNFLQSSITKMNNSSTSIPISSKSMESTTTTTNNNKRPSKLAANNNSKTTNNRKRPPTLIESEWPEPGLTLKHNNNKKFSTSSSSNITAQPLSTFISTTNSSRPTKQTKLSTMSNNSTTSTTNSSTMKISDILSRQILKAESSREQVSPSTSPIRPTNNNTNTFGGISSSFILPPSSNTNSNNNHPPPAFINPAFASQSTSSNDSPPFMNQESGIQNSSSTMIITNGNTINAINPIFGTPPRPNHHNNGTSSTSARQIHSSSRKDTRPSRASFLSRTIRRARSDVREMLVQTELSLSQGLMKDNKSASQPLSQTDDDNQGFKISRLDKKIMNKSVVGNTTSSNTPTTILATCSGGIINAMSFSTTNTEGFFYFPIVEDLTGISHICCCRLVDPEKSALSRLNHLLQRQVKIGIKLRIHQPYLFVMDDHHIQIFNNNNNNVVVVCSGLVEIV
jgi:hypothetical protein